MVETVTNEELWKFIDEVAEEVIKLKSSIGSGSGSSSQSEMTLAERRNLLNEVRHLNPFNLKTTTSNDDCRTCANAHYYTDTKRDGVGKVSKMVCMLTPSITSSITGCNQWQPHPDLERPESASEDASEIPSGKLVAEAKAPEIQVQCVQCVFSGHCEYESEHKAGGKFIWDGKQIADCPSFKNKNEF